MRNFQRLVVPCFISVSPFFSQSAFIKFLSALLPAIVPPLHIFVLYYFWSEFSRIVDRRSCSCSCWDTVFKGTYETGIAQYKHFYFNATSNTAKIWILTVLCIILFYECVRRIFTLSLDRRLRFSMIILFTTSVFSNYYSWWTYVNYWNDDFYKQWNHQLFFTITEFISTAYVVHLMDSKNHLLPQNVLPIVGIAIIHILAASIDQFVTNVLKGEGHMHQVIRDICLMIPDILHVSLPLIDLRCNQKRALRALNIKETSLKTELLTLLFIVSFGLLVISYL